jgi:hypothetical protein
MTAQKILTIDLGPDAINDLKWVEPDVRVTIYLNDHNLIHCALWRGTGKELQMMMGDTATSVSATLPGGPLSKRMGSTPPKP